MSIISTVKSVPALKGLEEELQEYLQTMLEDVDATTTSGEELWETIGPFLESAGVATDDREGKMIADALLRGLSGEEATPSTRPAAASHPPDATPDASTTGAASKQQPHNSATPRQQRRIKLRPRSQRTGKKDAAPESAPAAPAPAPAPERLDDVRKLNAPVTLGTSGGGADGDDEDDTGMVMDFLWGRDSNLYLNSNDDITEREKTEKEEFRINRRFARYEEREQRKEARERARLEARLGLEPPPSRTGTQAAAGAGQPEGDGPAAAGGKQEGKAPIILSQVEEGSGKNQDIHIPFVNMGYSANSLLEGAEVNIHMGRRYGLVGRNGLGKTTLLKRLASREVDGIPPGVRILHVEQEVAADDTTVLQTVLDSDVERRKLLEEESAIHARLESDDAAPRDTARLKEIAERMEAIGAYAAEARAAEILAGLQFSQEMQMLPTSALSGGWRMRVALACALFVSPDLLLLDEPTNHLDFPAVAWLEEHLRRYPPTASLVIVSHDRRFLDNVITDVIHLQSKKLHYYRGNYSQFEVTRAEQARHQQRAHEAQETRRKEMQEFIDKFRANAKRATLVQSRIKAMQRMEVIEAVSDTEDKGWRFTFPEPGALQTGAPVLQIADVGFGYDPARPLFRNVNFGVDMDTRMAILGPNGVGKSTLLKLMTGELTPTEGHIARNPKLKVATFTQHHAAQLDVMLSPLELIKDRFPRVSSDESRKHLARFGVSGDLALQRIATLSGGQKSRIAFALLSFQRPHILIFDEPTNHLDIPTIDALITAVAEFRGGVIVVSHDQHLIEHVAPEHLFVIGNQRLSRFRGTLQDYKRVAEAEAAVPQGPRVSMW